MAEAPEIDIEWIRMQAFMRRITFRQVARASGISYERTGRLLRGERRPKSGELEALARAVGIAVAPAGSADDADAASPDPSEARGDRAPRSSRVARG